MRIVFSFLPTVMMSGRGRLRCYPRWIIIWTEADGPKPIPRPCGCAIAQIDNKKQPATMVMINFIIVPSLGAAAQQEDEQQDRKRYSD
jgi:hypothetical protein